MASTISESSLKKLLETINSDIDKRVLIKNKDFFRSWWKSWKEWDKWNTKLQEMIKEENIVNLSPNLRERLNTIWVCIDDTRERLAIVEKCLGIGSKQMEDESNHD